MTISNATRKAGPFVGNGASTVFPFTFKVFDKTDIKVLKLDSNGISTPLVLDSDYSVLLNPNQDSSPGGQITYPVIGLPLAAGYQLVMLGDLPYDQETDITNAGGFYPQVIEDMVDRATIQIQQLEEITSRAIVVSESESLNPVLPTAQARAGTVLGFDSQGGVTLLPQPSTLGGGNMRTDVFRSANGDFVPGTTRAFTLSRDPGSADNVWAWWDGAQQFDFVLTGTTLTFNDPVDPNVTVVRLRTGTVLSTFTPSAGSVGDAALQWGTSLRKNFTSIAKLRSNTDPRFQSFFVTGYYNPLDGGGGPYEVDPLDTTSADNGGSILVDALGRRCKLVGNPDWYVEQFGAKGDGVADDTAAINAAIAALPDNGGTVRLRGKTYVISNSIIIGNGNGLNTPSTKNGVKLIGQGAGLGQYSNPTLIQAKDNGSATPYIDTMLLIRGPIEGLHIEGFKLYGHGANSSANGSLVNTGIFLNGGVTGSTFSKITIVFYTLVGMWVLAGGAPTGNYNIFNEFHQVNGISNVDGHIGLLMNGVYAVSNDTWISSFYNCRFDTNSANNAFAGYFQFVDSINFHRCHFGGNNVGGVGQPGTIGCYFNAVGNPGFPCGMHFDFCSILNTFVNENSTDKIRKITFIGYGTYDNETIPTHPFLIGITDQGVRFNGWGA
ncbi:glycosyl hydrolase family 28-related protein [Paraburkholderia sp. RL17-373-BIF-A]|uniref:glycosyl hydrolase family 28-related protein n=1 Tax=Paraburkholderia sp. RL17-373-BIF-A TaxID=3031629 RepID=UPI0038BC94CD